MLTITPIPAFQDNYIWALHTPTGDCAVVDPGDAKPVEQFLADHGLRLSAILITHHHFDHVGGLKALCAKRDIAVYGPDNPRIDGITVSLSDGARCQLPAFGLDFEVLAVPGHTLDHIVYYSAEQKLLLCGDTLFHCGCGRLFEGSPQQMLDSLNRLAALPADTAVYCTHEYTLANMAFALAVDPHNSALKTAHSNAEALRAQQRPTLPSSIGEQRRINPFLRSADAALAQRVADEQGCASDPLTVFTALRAYKDRF